MNAAADTADDVRDVVAAAVADWADARDHSDLPALVDAVMERLADAADAAEPERGPLMIRCDDCGAEFYGDVSRWWAVYTGGEMWSETCPHCRRTFQVTLRFRRGKRIPAGERLPDYAVLITAGRVRT